MSFQTNPDFGLFSGLNYLLKREGEGENWGYGMGETLSSVVYYCDLTLSLIPDTHTLQ